MFFILYSNRLSSYLSTSARHFIRQAVEVMNKEKKNKSAPVIIAPITLVAANVTARRTTDNKIAPKIPARINESGALMQLLLPQQFWLAATARFTARYTTAIPKTTHKNAGVTVITAVILKSVVTIPIIILAAMANKEHSEPLSQEQEQLYFDIFSPPIILYESVYK